MNISIIVIIEGDSRPQAHTSQPRPQGNTFPGYALRSVTRGGKSFDQWYQVGPRHVSRMTQQAEAEARRSQRCRNSTAA